MIKVFVLYSAGNFNVGLAIITSVYVMLIWRFITYYFVLIVGGIAFNVLIYSTLY